MEKRLPILLFLTGVVPLVLSVTRKYYLIQQGKNWNDARTYCQAEHTDLAIIERNDELVQMQNLAQTQQFSSSAWIGLYNDVNSWRWSYGDEPLGSVVPWCPGEPNNGGGHQSCGYISSLGWGDSACPNLAPLICFDDNETGSQRYIYISTKMSWYNAQIYCRTHYTDLASSNATENPIILGLISVTTWFGLFRDSWKWVDRTNFTTYPISWMTGKPDNALGKENCGYLNHGRVADAQCPDIMPFFCYSVITGKRLIMRVTVQSRQDVNDPAVKAAIMEQIKLNLMNHGMAENIKVNWREQPNGQVFHLKKANDVTEKEEEIFSCDFL